MNLRALLALAGIALATTACAVWAADATPPAPAASDPARMERVLRDAANPMRMILEAAKLRPARTTVVVPQPVVATVPPPAAARPVAAAPVQAAPVPVRSPVVDAAPPLQPTASAALPPALTPAAAPLVPAEPPLA
ncbi:MAG: hypothetical protein HY021_08420, partial [Burkholderiales bacterium]|nr:hypothetical protein [Burkholderiales bacterium]